MPREIHRIARLDLVEQRASEWTEFSARVSLPAPFCGAPTWIAWLEVYRENEPVVYELREDSRLLAILPMYRKGMALHVASDFHLDYQEIAAESHETAVELLLGVIEREGEKGLSLSFAKVAEHSRLFAVLSDPRVEERASIQSRYQSICPTVTYAIDSEGGIFKSLAGRQRRDHRTSKKRLESEFPDHRIEHCTGDEITLDRLAPVGRLHREGHGHKKPPSVFVDPGFSQFLRQQADRNAPLTLSVIWRDKTFENPLAFNLSYFFGDTFYYYMTAYDLRQSRLSPGRYLMVEAMEHAAAQVTGKVLRFDLLSGEEAYKSRWAKSFYEVTRFQVIPRRLSNLPRVAAYSAIYRLKGAKNALKGRLGREPLSDLEHEMLELPS